MKDTMKMPCFWIIFFMADIKARSASEYKAAGVTPQEFFNSCKTHVKVASVSSSKIAAATIRFRKLLSTTVHDINIQKFYYYA
jgi:hypothetical protein